MANHGHKRDTNARRKPPVAYIAAPIAAVATIASVGIGVLASNPDIGEVVSADHSNSASLSNAIRQERTPEVSRSDARANDKLITASAKFSRKSDVAATSAAVKAADTKLWTTAELNIWDSSFDDAENLGTIEESEQVLVTGREDNDRSEVVIDGESRWVTSGYFDDEKPEPEPDPAETDESAESDSPEVSARTATCSNGSSVESGVSPNIVKVHEAVCAAFPEITTYGTFRGDGEHAQGLAVDIMVSGDRGYQVADFVRSHYGELGVNYVIYSQRIWSVDRSGEGWRGMEDRGSTTANHYDHVHVTTY
ncbi:MAG: hypothetical protein L0H93_05050 [Nocardioides sp.]|nr:hypothetical protein [Nocardioides sp.]